MIKTTTLVSRKLHQQVSVIPYEPLGNNLPEKYFNIGKHFQKEINSSIFRTFKFLKRKGKIKENVKLALNIINNLNKIIESKSRYAYLAGEYVECLKSWSNGANIRSVAKKFGKDPIIIAMILQNDDSGCQTAMIRVNGGITLLHTEEDDSTIITNRVSNSFLVKLNNSLIFTYNDLLPVGSAFVVDKNNNFAFSCDTLRVKGNLDGVCVAKILGWMIWRIGNKVTPEIIKDLVTEFGPFIDGYSINIVLKMKSDITGYRVTVVSNLVDIQILEKKIGSYILQTNLVDSKIYEKIPKLKKEALTENIINKDIEPNHRPGGYYKSYLDRVISMEDLIKSHTKELFKDWSKIDATILHRKIYDIFALGFNKKYFGKKSRWDISNISVGATLSVFIGNEMTNFGVNLGPPLVLKNQDKEKKLKTPTLVD